MKALRTNTTHIVFALCTLCIVAAVSIMATGCVSTQDGKTDVRASLVNAAQITSEGSKWVLDATDTAAPILCQTGVLDQKACLAYGLSSARLKALTAKLDARAAAYAATGSEADKSALLAAKAEAEKVYYEKVEPVYRAQAPKE